VQAGGERGARLLPEQRAPPSPATECSYRAKAKIELLALDLGIKTKQGAVLSYTRPAMGERASLGRAALGRAALGRAALGRGGLYTARARAQPPPRTMEDTGESSAVPDGLALFLGHQIPCFLLHRATQKKRKTPFERAPRETTKSGVFLVHRRRRKFFSATQELQTSERGQFGLRMEKMAHIKPILCVFGTLFCSSGYTAPEMHHQQANIIQTTRAGAWPVWLIW
jgi:hypothetical protein